MAELADADMMSAVNAQAWGAQSRLIVEFYLSPVRDELRSEAEGRPIYEDAEFIRIRVPGDRNEIRERPVRQSDRVQHAQQYMAFKLKKEQPIDGTPLEHVPFLTRAQVLEFQALGLRTAENIRDMPDAHAGKLMGMHEVRRKIGSWLKAAADAAPVQKLEAEIAQRESQIKTLEQAVASLTEKIDAMSKKK